jgi:uncharacterized secreted protein with C-terminal beta-propeller domain
MPRPIVHLVVATLAACVAGSALPPAGAVAASRLTAFSSCQELVDHAKRHALETIGTGPGRPDQGVTPTTEREAATEGEDFSSTNVQELGVDEPDIVKTDGATMFTVAGGRLRAVDARGAVPRVLGTLALPDSGDHQLLLRGQRLLVLSNLSGPVPLPVDQGAERIAPYPTHNAAVLSEVDVSNPAAPRVVRKLRVDGRYLNARLTGSVARVMVTSTPRVFERPPPGPPVADQAPEVDDGGASLRAAIERSGAADWIPSYTLEGSGQTATRTAVDCQAVRRPPEFSGLDILTVLTIDLSRGVEPVDSDGLMASAETVYASTRGLYLASQRVPTQPRPSAPMSTEIHKFDISSATATEYRASGEVQGSLLNQFSLSEHAGNLRVATTVDPLDGQPAGRSQSFVTVLAERAGELAVAGRVGGLGRGERVFAVRFIGDTGFVVTFRQVDPLYTLDLSRPAQPRVLGELKIRGYSSYLHPVGPDLLLGVGQDATDQGMVQGTQVSLFDVSDLAAPRRVARRALGTGASSEAEFDHHAFLYWPGTRLAVLPLSVSAPQGGQSFSGVLGLRVGAAGLGEAGRMSQPPAEPAPIRRSLVIGGRLFTLSEQGVRAASLATLAGGAFVRFN